MSFAEPTPEKRPVKITYSSKMRQKRDSVLHNKDEETISDSENEEQNAKQEMPVEEASPKRKPSAKPDSSDSVKSESNSRAHIEPLNLPGPTPRHRDSKKSELSVDSTKSKHAKSSSGDVFTIPIDGVRSDKPLSSISAKLSLMKASQRAGTPDSTFNAGSASAASTPDKSRSRMTESERLNFLRDEAEIGEVEPHRVFCRACEKWIALHPQQKYALSKWKTHKTRCTASHKSPEADSDAEDDTGSVVQSVAASESISVSTSQPGTIRRIRRSLEERQKYLEEDALIDQVLPNEVHCRECNTWIKLSSKTHYALNKWQVHADKVHSVRRDGPSRRVQEAERKLKIVNDAQAGEFAPSWILCRICSTRVKLSDKVHFDLTNWIAHKEQCSESNPHRLTSSIDALQSPKRLSAATTQKGENDALSNVFDAFPVTPSANAEGAAKAVIPPDRPSPSSTTEITLVESNGEPNTELVADHGTKRKREDNEAGEETKHRAVRPRTATYQPPDAEPPRPWGWLLYPWESFKRGFLEGLWANS